MAKTNSFNLEGTISEISEPRFLQNGAEVQTIVIKWLESWDGGSREACAAVGFYASRGLDKLHKLNLAVGDSVSIPCQPSSRVKEGVSANGPWRMWQTDLRGDSYGVVVKAPGEAAGVNASDIDF